MPSRYYRKDVRACERAAVETCELSDLAYARTIDETYRILGFIILQMGGPDLPADLVVRGLDAVG